MRTFTCHSTFLYGLFPHLDILAEVLTGVFPGARRWVTGDVHDGGPEEVLRRHEENGQEEARQGHPPTQGRTS